MKRTALAAAVATFASAAFALPLENGLAAYFTFDEATPVNHALDATVTGLTLSGSGAASGETGAAKYGFGGCLDLAGGYASVDGSESLAFDNGNNFTLVVWVRSEAAPVGDPVFAGNGNWDAARNPGVVLCLDTNSAKPNGYAVCNYSDRDSGSGRQRINTDAIALGEWTFYAISRTSDNKFRFWRSRSDGSLQLVAENDAYGLQLVDSTPKKFHLGQDGTGSYKYPFTGRLDEFALWTRGLGAADIERIYNNGRSVNGRKAGTLADLMAPAMSVENSVGSQDEINFTFTGIRGGDYTLKVAYGTTDGGADISAWDNTATIATIRPGDTSYTYTRTSQVYPRYRFFLMKDADYQQIEYVENTGGRDTTSAYANTVSASDGKGVTPTRNTIVKGEVEYVEAASDRGTWNNIFGCSDSSFFQFGVHNSSAPYDWYTELRKLESGGNTFMGTVTPGDRYAFEYCVANMTVWNVSSSGAAVSAPLLSAGTTFNDMTTDKFTIFRCTKSTGAIYDRPFTGKIYSFEILEGAVAIRDYVPVKRLADGKAGFYDLVNGDFKPSESTVDFVGGAAVAGAFTLQSATRKVSGTGDPVTAYWIGGADGALDDAANWHCEDGDGNAVASVPQSFTRITVPTASALFNVPAGTSFDCNYIHFENPVALAGDLDLSGLDASKKVWIASALDLAGHNLSLTAAGDITVAILATDTVGGGEVRVSVPEGATAVNTALALSGAATLVKEDAGTFVTVKTGQANSGGVRVDAGTLVTTNYINSAVLGAAGSKVEIGRNATLRVENSYQGLEAHELVLAGGTLYMYNSELIDGRSVIGSLAQTANSTILIESTGGNDGKRDTELAADTVWDLGGNKLTVRLNPGDTDFFMTAGTVISNGWVDLPSVMPNATGGWVHFYGIDATDNVRMLYGMNTVRWQNSASYVLDFDNQIPSGANIGGATRLFVSGVYRPYPGLASDIAGQVRLLDGSTLYLGGHANVTWSTSLGGDRVLEYGIIDAPAGTVTTINVDLGTRTPETESSLSSPGKLVSWSEAPAGVKFVPSDKKYVLVPQTDGLYAVRCRGTLLIFK
jgi:hypothetical protein